jgi:ribosomal protein S18 acetylase RimI-like enzyme
VAVIITCPDGHNSRDYGGAADHAAMAAVLSAFHLSTGDGELITTEQLDLTYSHIPIGDLKRDVVIIEHHRDGIVGYGRTGWDDTPEGRTHYWVAPLLPDHLSQALLTAMVTGLEGRAAERAAEQPGLIHLLRCWMPHPGPDQPLGDSPVAWLEAIGYRTARFVATMVRLDLDDIADLAMPDGVEVRPVRAEELRTIWEADVAAFAGGFGSQKPTEAEWLEFRDNPIADPTMWKVAWSDDRVVAQVRSYINHQENESQGRLRGYTEFISTHVDWRGRGRASALLAASLSELRERGMTEAALGVDTENPANAFGIYERLGFRLTGYEAVLDKPLPSV